MFSINKLDKKFKYKELIIIFLICLIAITLFFGKVFIKKQVLLPSDLLVGAYYPWYEYKWGYEVGVPIKNTLISDSFSQMFVWKKVMLEAINKANFPLWNIYSYSGYPLLANVQSAVLYPLNIFFFIFDFFTAWNFYLVFGTFLSLVSMYFLLRQYKLEKTPSFIGAFSFAFCGFSMVWMEFATASQAMAFIPLAILIIEKYFAFNKNSIKILGLLPFVIFLQISSGHFQISIYTIMISILLIFLRYFQLNNKKISYLLIPMLYTGLGLLLSFIILVPSFELFFLSIRGKEDYIRGFNYGLLPLKNIITVFAPDYFGNPTTGNFWGISNYVETITYQGAFILLLVGYIALQIKKASKINIYYLLVAFLSLVFLIDNPISNIFFKSKFPLISTSSAGRIIILFNFSISYFLAEFLTNYHKFSKKGFKKYQILSLALFMLVWLVVIINRLGLDSVKQVIILRNMVYPSLLFVLYFISIALGRWKKKILILFFLILFVDLYRFSWKFLPAIDRKLVFPDTKITDFLKKEKEIFRVDKEKGPILPPNTWTYYGIMSASGYDPMAVADYTAYFYKTFNNNVSYSRYGEINDNYDSELLGKFNIKYLLTNKNSGLYYVLNTKEKGWVEKFATRDVSVLENINVKPRVELQEIKGDDRTEIVKYDSNEIWIKYFSNNHNYLILRDTWYPGWEAHVNGNEVEIEKAEDVFRKVKIQKGEGEVIFKYNPLSFKYGTIVSFITLFMTFVITFFLNKKKLNEK